jgi:hypothetical protein
MGGVEPADIVRGVIAPIEGKILENRESSAKCRPLRQFSMTGATRERQQAMGKESGRAVQRCVRRAAATGDVHCVI